LEGRERILYCLPGEMALSGQRLGPYQTFHPSSVPPRLAQRRRTVRNRVLLARRGKLRGVQALGAPSLPGVRALVPSWKAPRQC
jgi:hypothetical protein